MLRIARWACWSVLAISATAFAAPVKTQDVTFMSGPESIAGYLATPDSPGKHPAMLVLHEEWGMTDWVRDQTRKLADEGYVALAVDLYRGERTFDPSDAYDLMVEMPQERAMQDMETAFNFLAARPDVNKDKIGSIGWSMGGKLSLLFAAAEPRLAACVMNYGALITDPAEIQKIHAPVLGIFGYDDHTISSDDIDTFVKATDDAHKTFELKVYPHAGRDFENSEGKLAYREGDADDAWQRTIAFLNQHLK